MYWLPTFNAAHLQKLILNIVVCQLIWKSSRVHFQEVLTETLYTCSKRNLNLKASHKMHYTHEHKTLALKPRLVCPYTRKPTHANRKLGYYTKFYGQFLTLRPSMHKPVNFNHCFFDNKQEDKRFCAE
jgi:hypothetical protein